MFPTLRLSTLLPPFFSVLLQPPVLNVSASLLLQWQETWLRPLLHHHATEWTFLSSRLVGRDCTREGAPFVFLSAAQSRVTSNLSSNVSKHVQGCGTLLKFIVVEISWIREQRGGELCGRSHNLSVQDFLFGGWIISHLPDPIILGFSDKALHLPSTWLLALHVLI